MCMYIYAWVYRLTEISATQGMVYVHNALILKAWLSY